MKQKASVNVKKDQPRNKPRLPPIELIRSVESKLRYSTEYSTNDDFDSMKTSDVQFGFQSMGLTVVSKEYLTTLHFG